jgi:hypothetical protein
MIVYQYDDYNIYVGQVECQRNPLRREEFLIPRNCTDITPPELKESEIAVFKDNSWEIVKLTYNNDIELCTDLLKNPTKDNIKQVIKILMEKL